MAENSLSRPPRVLVLDLAAYRDASEEDEILLGKEEREHVRSRRIRDGDEVVLIDGKGLRVRSKLTRNGTAVIPSPSFKESSCSSSFSLPLPGEPTNRVTVLLACAEPARIEWAIEKGTECGAAGFVLLDAERSQRAHVAALAKRRPRLVRIAEEATKQCDRTLVPFVEGPKSIEEFLGKGRGDEALFVADPSGVPIASVAPGAMTLAIGPEGGFSPSEISLFKANRSFFVSLGPRILRLETAVVVALARLVDPA